VKQRKAPKKAKAKKPDLKVTLDPDVIRDLKKRMKKARPPK
jgi:hypothetical protein